MAFRAGLPLSKGGEEIEKIIFPSDISQKIFLGFPEVRIFRQTFK